MITGAPSNGALVTRDTLAESLARLHPGPVRDVLVHVSFGAFKRSGKWVDGGPATLLAVLRDVFGHDLNVVVPTQTAQNSRTSAYYRANTSGMSWAQERHYRQRIIEPFDSEVTPSYRMGIFAEYLRTLPGAVRSLHPQTSFAAFGPDAVKLVSSHPYNCHLGWQSPLGELYQRGAHILRIGTEVCPALHLAEYDSRLPQVTQMFRSKVRRRVLPGGRWVRFKALRSDDSDFPALKVELEAEPWLRRGESAGVGISTLPMRETVNFASAWFLAHRAGAVPVAPHAAHTAV